MRVISARLIPLFYKIQNELRLCFVLRTNQNLIYTLHAANGGYGLQSMDWPFVISVVGTVASALGFLFTVMQLKRTAAATKSAAMAIGSLKNRMATHDLVAECLMATKALQHAARSLNIQQWDDAVHSLLDAQTSINRISVSTKAATNLRDEASEMSETLIIAISDIEDVSIKQSSYDAKHLIVSIRKFASKLDARVSSSNQEILE